MQIENNKIRVMFRKNENAITVIALIITIVILLILSGISISMLTRRKWNIN